ncbi:thioester reductase, partial [Nocardia nova]
VAAHAHAAARIERITHQLRGAVAVAAGAPFQALVTVRTEVIGANAREIARRVARPHGVDIVADVVTGGEEVTVILEFPAALAGRIEIDALASGLERWLLNLAEPETALPDGELPTVFERAAAYPGGTGLGGQPSTDAERLIADTIREVLELDADDEVGRADTFFSLGGDSIAALRMVTLLGERGYVLDVQKVFEFPAVHEMAAQLTEAAAAPAAEQSAPVAPMSASGLDSAALAALGKKFAAR